MGLAAQTRVRGEGSHPRTQVLLRKPSQGSFLLLRPRRPHAAPPPPRHAAIGERRVEGWGGFCRLPGPVSPHKGRRGRPGCGGRRRFRGSREVKGSLPGLGLGLPSTAVAGGGGGGPAAAVPGGPGPGEDSGGRSRPPAHVRGVPRHASPGMPRRRLRGSAVARSRGAFPGAGGAWPRRAPLFAGNALPLAEPSHPGNPGNPRTLLPGCGGGARPVWLWRGLGRPKPVASPPPGCPAPREPREAEAAPTGPRRAGRRSGFPGVRGRGLGGRHCGLATLGRWRSLATLVTLETRGRSLGVAGSPAGPALDPGPGARAEVHQGSPPGMEEQGNLPSWQEGVKGLRVSSNLAQ